MTYKFSSGGDGTARLIVDVSQPGPRGLDGVYFDPAPWSETKDYPFRGAVKHDHKLWYALGRNTGVEPGTDNAVWHLWLDGATAAELAQAVERSEAARDRVVEAEGKIIPIEDDILALSAIKDDLSAVAGIKDDVSAAAAISGQITIVANRDQDIETVAARDAAIETVANRDGDIATVAARSAVIQIVADRDAAIAIVADRDEDIATVASIAGPVAIVAGIEDEVRTTAANAEAIALVADEIDAIKAAPAAATTSADARDKSQAWAEGTEPDGPGTKSSQGHALDAAGSASIAAAATLIEYGINLYYPDGVPSGGWPSKRYTPFANTQEIIFAEIEGEPDSQISVVMLVGGIPAYGPFTVSLGERLVLTGLEIPVGTGKGVSYMITTSAGVRRISIESNGKLL